MPFYLSFNVQCILQNKAMGLPAGWGQIWQRLNPCLFRTHMTNSAKKGNNYLELLTTRMDPNLTAIISSFYPDTCCWLCVRPSLYLGLFWSRECPITVLLDRPHFAKMVAYSRAPQKTSRAPIRRQSCQSFEDRVSLSRIGYRKSDRLLFRNMFLDSSRSKSVGPRSF